MLIKSLLSLRKFFATFAVNGFLLFKQSDANPHKISLRCIETNKIVIFIEKYLRDYKNSHIFVVKDCFVASLLAMTDCFSKF